MLAVDGYKLPGVDTEEEKGKAGKAGVSCRVYYPEVHQRANTKRCSNYGTVA